MKYVIVNHKPYNSRPAGTWFVTRSGSQASYTLRLQDAQTFYSEEEAEQSRCSNEYIISVESVMAR